MFNRGVSKGDPSRGQVVALFAISALAMIAMIAVVIDGGNALAQHRIGQNGTDAAAEAGGIVLAENLGGASRTDADVLAGITNAATTNGVTVAYSEYTNLQGVSIKDSGGAPVQVGSLSPGAPPPSGSAGVRVFADREFDTFFARTFGQDRWTATTDATAVTGYVPNPCTLATGCPLLPVTVPITVLSCSGSNKPVPVTPLQYWGTNYIHILPLCHSDPGNVGWLDWTPTAGGMPELEASILTPNNPAIPLPSWQFVTETGNPNPAYIQAALRTYDGQIVWIPIFDASCATKPPGPSVGDCTSGPGNGSQNWYHLPTVAAFQFCSTTVAACGPGGTTNPANTANKYNIGFTHGAYTAGGPAAECAAATSSNATSCLVGRFVNFVTEGTVGAGTGSGGLPGPTNTIGVQLIE